MTRVQIPWELQPFTGGLALVEGRSGGSLRSVLAELAERFPGLGERLVDGAGRRRSYLTVLLGDVDVRGLADLDTPVSDGDEITILPPIAGG